MLKLVLLCALAVSSEITEEEDVLVLKKSNFEEALKAHPNILVEFCKYTWRGCGIAGALPRSLLPWLVPFVRLSFLFPILVFRTCPFHLRLCNQLRRGAVTV